MSVNTLELKNRKHKRPVAYITQYKLGNHFIFIFSLVDFSVGLSFKLLFCCFIQILFKCCEANLFYFTRTATKFIQKKVRNFYIKINCLHIILF